MYTYTIIQWLFFFYFYCFFGWCFESTVVSVSKRKLVNRGFMRGPFLPLYGTGAIMMLLVSLPFQNNILLVYIVGCIATTILEYVTGVIMEALFKIRYWDYSKKRFNFRGHICLSSSLAWGLLTILMTEVVHKPIETFVLSLPSVWLTAITLLLTAVISGDFSLSFKAAIDLREMLEKMGKAKEELLYIQKRLDVIIAITNEEWIHRKEELTESIGAKVEDLKKSIEDSLEKIKTLPHSKKANYPDGMKEEIKELRIRYHINIENREKTNYFKNFYQKDLIRSNPTISSKKFKESLEELKRWLENKEGESKKKD